MELAHGLDVHAHGTPVPALHQVVLAALGELQVETPVRIRPSTLGDREVAPTEVFAEELLDLLPRPLRERSSLAVGQAVVMERRLPSTPQDQDGADQENRRQQPLQCR